MEILTPTESQLVAGGMDTIIGVEVSTTNSEEKNLLRAAVNDISQNTAGKPLSLNEIIRALQERGLTIQDVIVEFKLPTLTSGKGAK